MFAAVHAHPDGQSTLARQAVTAAEYGFEGIVLRNHGDALGEFDVDKIRDAIGIDVALGVELRGDTPSEISGYLGMHRPERSVVIVHGGDQAVNKFAVTQDRVDVLAHPTHGTGEIDHVLVKHAAAHDVRLEFNLGRVLRASGGTRVRSIAALQKLRDLVEDADAPYVVSRDSISHLELRAPRELIAVGTTIGFEASQIEAGLTEWQTIVSRNRGRLDPDCIGPGVSRTTWEDGG